MLRFSHTFNFVAMQSFVKLPGPIDFVDSSDDDLFIVNTVSKNNSSKKEKKKTPKSKSKIKQTEQKTPRTEINPPTLVSIRLSPQQVTPKNSPFKNTNSSSFIPKSPVPSPKQQSQRLQSSLFKISEDTRNYSSILKQKSPIVASNTEEATIEETYRQLYNSKRDKNKVLMHQKLELERKLRRSKLEYQKRLANQRDTNRNLQTMSSSDLQSDKESLKNIQEQLKQTQYKIETDEKYTGLQFLREEAKLNRNSIQNTKEIIESLDRVLQFSPLNKLDFQPILTTFEYSNEIGEKLQTLVKILQDSFSTDF